MINIKEYTDDILLLFLYNQKDKAVIEILSKIDPLEFRKTPKEKIFKSLINDHPDIFFESRLFNGFAPWNFGKPNATSDMVLTDTWFTPWQKAYKKCI
jgi:hypothetical protein